MSCVGADFYDVQMFIIMIFGIVTFMLGWRMTAKGVRPKLEKIIKSSVLILGLVVSLSSTIHFLLSKYLPISHSPLPPLASVILILGVEIMVFFLLHLVLRRLRTYWGDVRRFGIRANFIFRAVCIVLFMCVCVLWLYLLLNMCAVVWVNIGFNIDLSFIDLSFIDLSLYIAYSIAFKWILVSQMLELPIWFFIVFLAVLVRELYGCLRWLWRKVKSK